MTLDQIVERIRGNGSGTRVADAFRHAANVASPKKRRRKRKRKRRMTREERQEVRECFENADSPMDREV